MAHRFPQLREGPGVLSTVHPVLERTGCAGGGVQHQNGLVQHRKQYAPWRWDRKGRRALRRRSEVTEAVAALAHGCGSRAAAVIPVAVTAPVGAGGVGAWYGRPRSWCGRKVGTWVGHDGTGREGGAAFKSKGRPGCHKEIKARPGPGWLRVQRWYAHYKVASVADAA